MTSLPNPTYLLVDAHVHLHDCFDLSQFLDAASANFQQQSDRLGLDQPAIGILLLAEVKGVNAFTQLVEQQQQLNQQLSSWKITPTHEAISLRLTHTSGQTLLIMAGRQVVTEEGIEVLALMTEGMLEDGFSLEKTLAEAIAANSLPVLPWGVGKWLGKRGKLVASGLAASPDTLFAGDNGGRPGFWPLPSFCKRQLPGTDPLPLSYEVERPGSFGFVTQAVLDRDRPGECLKQVLSRPQPDIQTYGRAQSPWRFLKNQSLLRLS